MAGQFTRYVRLVGICFVLMGCVVHPSSSQNPGSSSNDAVLQWNRDGGFAGFCDELKISAGGAIATSSCRPPGAGPARTLAGNDAATFNQIGRASCRERVERGQSRRGGSTSR